MTFILTYLRQSDQIRGRVGWATEWLKIELVVEEVDHINGRWVGFLPKRVVWLLTCLKAMLIDLVGVNQVGYHVK